MRSLTPLQELQRLRLLAEHKQVCRLFERAQKQWLRAATPSLALRQMSSVGNLLTKHIAKGKPRS